MTGLLISNMVTELIRPVNYPGIALDVISLMAIEKGTNQKL